MTWFVVLRAFSVFDKQEQIKHSLSEIDAQPLFSSKKPTLLHFELPQAVFFFYYANYILGGAFSLFS